MTPSLPQLDLIPLAMRQEPRWGVWRYETRKARPTKVPYSILSSH